MLFGVEKFICKACNKPALVKFISFGKMPIANAFLTKETLEKGEFYYNLDVGFCEECKMVQLIEMPPYSKYIVPDDAGKTHYAFFSSTSKFMEKHFAEMAKEAEEKFLDENSQVLDIGSNDGILLKAFKNNKTLGIEPSDNVADVARTQGVETISKFFTEELAGKILAEKGNFKVIFSTNVLLSIIEIGSCMKGIERLLANKGVFITEDPYIPEILEKVSYDQIYDAHVWYFSLTSLSNLFERYGLEVFDAEKQWVHGGSMRVYACRKGDYPKTDRLKKYLQEEKEKDIDTIQPYLELSKKVEQSRIELKALLRKLKDEGKKIVGYAAASKGTIVQNYCDIGRETLEYISDSTPFKQGRFSPGKHIPIVSPEHFHEDNADYALLSAWNHAEEIMQKESEFLKRGGRFIVHYPTPRILEPESTNKPSNNQNSEAFPGVEIKKLNVIANGQGYLFEVVRNDDNLFSGKFGQTLVSELYPGTIKGLHKHSKQTDYTTCIKGNIKYVLVDDSQEPAKIKVLTIGEKNSILVKTPPGYWHGYMPLANEKATVLHLMDRTYNPKKPDTERKDAFAFGDVWTVRPS